MNIDFIFCRSLILEVIIPTWQTVSFLTILFPPKYRCADEFLDNQKAVVLIGLRRHYHSDALRQYTRNTVRRRARRTK